MHWKDIIQNNSNGGYDIDFNQLLETHPITDEDLSFCEEIINTAKNGGMIEYDMFADRGGIAIAALLMAEVKQLRMTLKNQS